VRGNSAAGPVGRPASFPRKRVGGAPGVLATATEKQNSILYERINGNDELTETENGIFLRKLLSSYGILTDLRNSYVVFQRRYGYGGTET